MVVTHQPRGAGPASPTSLYQRLLGPAFARLSPILQRVHDARSTKRYVGRCEVRSGVSCMAKLIARIASLPAASSDVALEVVIDSYARTERWTRRFGDQRMQSIMSSRGPLLQERLGLTVLTFELLAEQQRIVWSLRGAHLAFVRLPIAWLLDCSASEAIVEGRYGFDVSARVRGVGLIVHYQGWLVEDGAAA